MKGAVGNVEWRNEKCPFNDTGKYENKDGIPQVNLECERSVRSSFSLALKGKNSDQRYPGDEGENKAEKCLLDCPWNCI